MINYTEEGYQDLCRELDKKQIKLIRLEKQRLALIEATAKNAKEIRQLEGDPWYQDEGQIARDKQRIRTYKKCLDLMVYPSLVLTEEKPYSYRKGVLKISKVTPKRLYFTHCYSNRSQEYYVSLNGGLSNFYGDTIVDIEASLAAFKESGLPNYK